MSVPTVPSIDTPILVHVTPNPQLPESFIENSYIYTQLQKSGFKTLYGNQKDYITFSNEAVQRLVNGLKTRKNISLEEFLHECANERKNIANQMNTQKKELFGKPKITSDALVHRSLIALYEPRYCDYAKALMHNLNELMKFKQKQIDHNNSVCGMKITSRITVEPLDIGKLDAESLPTYKQRKQEFCEKATDGGIISYSEEYKNKSPDEFKTEIKKYLVREFNDELKYIKEHHFPIQESGQFIIATVYCQCESNKIYAIGRYVFTVDKQTNEVVNQFILFDHQNMFLNHYVIEFLSPIFKKAINWSKKDGIDTLKEHVGLIRYYLGLAAIFLRGSASISEYLEAAIYHYHDLQFQLDGGVCMDLEAISAMHNLSKFMQTYKDHTPISQE